MKVICEVAYWIQVKVISGCIEIEPFLHTHDGWYSWWQFDTPEEARVDLSMALMSIRRVCAKDTKFETRIVKITSEIQEV